MWANVSTYGGTALAAFYLGHRLSEDLDLFTLSDGALDAALDAALAVSDAAGWQITYERFVPHFLRTFVNGPGCETLKVEFIQDVGPQYGEKESCNGIVIDSLINIAVNKVTAIFGRAAGKDFVDLYVILHRFGYRPDDLMQMAREKDRGLTEFYLGTMLRQIHRVKTLPVMRAPVTLTELIVFYDPLADALIAGQRPDNG